MTQHNSKANTARSVLAPLAALALLTAAGCGGDGTGSPQRSPTSSVTASSHATSEPETEGNESETTGSATSQPNSSSEEDGGGSDENGDSGTGTGSGDDAPAPGNGDGSGSPGKRPAATLADIDPCALLTTAQRDELGLPRATANKKEGKSRSCEFNPPEGSGPNTSALIVIHEEKGLNTFSGMTGEAERTRIAGHESKIQCEYGNCLIGIAVTENSRVDVQSTVLGDDAATEKLGNRIAKMVTVNLSSS
ncbi:hypothetical protein CDG81_21800 [Actinopolyspora erythraea]|uniref:DUF3558 domain-containing protein n=1 Tax=Actinopolyspora erythraea TaxID=414996 RepID=A0A099D9U3_9ACTN|nr:DUF3558 family protein [Actinopolyspora erythraea]ASU80470.1 hypothetical protein CDG81_21800 [Actinopolyspora erythraea]KGI82859.1 hypothetical protein IL38_03065 [Actinopolyspora erythraea]